MKKLLVVVVVLFVMCASLSVEARSNKELYKALLSFIQNEKSSQTATVAGTENLPVYEINMGHVVYLAAKKSFVGEYKYYNFYLDKKRSSFYWMGVNADTTKEERVVIEAEILKWLKNQ